MPNAAPSPWVIVACASALFGCSTMKSAEDRHPGAVDPNPNAVTRVYHASSTRVAWAMTQVMANDPILDDVRVMVDPQSNESRALPPGEREKLGIPRLKVGSRDVDYDITARSKDGHKVGAVVQIKGDSDCEVTLLYGVVGDPDLSRSILDGVEAALAGPVKDPSVAQTAAPRPSPRKAASR